MGFNRAMDRRCLFIFRVSYDKGLDVIWMNDRRVQHVSKVLADESQGDMDKEPNSLVTQSCLLRAFALPPLAISAVTLVGHAVGLAAVARP